MPAVKKFFATVGIYLVPIISIMAAGILFYVPRQAEFWNYCRLIPFYAGIYFWTGRRADIFNCVSVFVLGIFADVIGSVPLGINITTFLVLYFLSAHFSSSFNIQKFSYSWLLFTLAASLTFLFKAATVSILYRRFVPLNSLLLELLFTITLYPLMARFYDWLEWRFIHLEEQYEKVQ